MRNISFLVLLLSVIFPVSSFTQEIQNSVRAELLGHAIELVPKKEIGTTDSRIVSVLADGKEIKQFAAADVSFPNIVATYDGIDGDYLIYRTNSGTGLCVAGSIYVLKFYTFDEHDRDVKVMISPDLSGCLGEYPTVSFNYDSGLSVVVYVNDSKINGDKLSRWTPPVKKSERRNKFFKNKQI